MENQYVITKDGNGNYVILNSESGEKLCGINCSVDDPCKNCDKCVMPTPPVPTLMPIPPVPIPPVPIPPVPISTDPVMIAKFKRALRNVDAVAPPTPKNPFVNEKGTLNTLSIVLICVGVLCLLLFMYFLFKKFKRSGKGYNMFGYKPSMSYNNSDRFNDVFEDVDY
jgi:hypothetical protein